MLRSLPQPHGVDGDAAQAAHELPPTPARPRVRPKIYLHDHPRTSEAADATRRNRRLRAKAGPAVLHPSGSPRRNSAGERGVDGSGSALTSPAPWREAMSDGSKGHAPASVPQCEILRDHLRPIGDVSRPDRMASAGIHSKIRGLRIRSIRPTHRSARRYSIGPRDSRACVLLLAPNETIGLTRDGASTTSPVRNRRGRSLMVNGRSALRGHRAAIPTRGVQPPTRSGRRAAPRGAGSALRR